MRFFFLLFLIFSFSVKAEVLLKDIGIIGLMSHDIFAWDHTVEENTENGRLDLSTIFDYEQGTRWKKGGNPKNAENSPVYTITMTLVEYYKKQLKSYSPETSRQRTVSFFHEMVKESFTRLSGLTFPTSGMNQAVKNIEQAALRGMHDILPGKVKLYRPIRDELVLTNFFTVKLRLNQEELNQEIPYFDGGYDSEYQSIKIPFTRKTLNLKEIDAKFIEKFSPYNQAEMLSELAKVGRGELDIQDVFFMHHIFELVSKAICPIGNIWMQQEVQCF